jgi:hypothetical protein
VVRRALICHQAANAACGLLPHEQGLLDAALPHQRRLTSAVLFSKLQTIFTSAQVFQQAVEEELDAMGFLTPINGVGAVRW